MLCENVGFHHYMGVAMISCCMAQTACAILQAVFIMLWGISQSGVALS